MKNKTIRRWIGLFSAAGLLLILYPALTRAEDFDLERVRKQYEKDIEAVTKQYEDRIPPESRNPDGTPNKNDPRYREIKGQYDEAINRLQEIYHRSYNQERISQHEQVMKELPPEIAEKIESTGRHPASIQSDLDLSPKDFEAARAYAEAMGKPGMGNTVERKGDRYTIKGKQDTTVWIKERPGSDPIGSSSYEAGVAHKASVDSDAYMSVGEGASKKVEILDHTRKFTYAKNTGDLRVQAKTVAKINKKVGGTPPDPDLIEQAKTLYEKNATLEQTGIVDFGDPPAVKVRKRENFTRRAESAIVDANQKVDVQSRTEREKLEADIKEAQTAGNKDKAAELKKTKIKSQIQEEASIKGILESDPELGGRLTGNEVTKVTNPDGSVLYRDRGGKVMTKSEFVYTVGSKIKGTVKSTAQTLNPVEPVLSFIRKPTATGGAAVALTLFFGYETWKEKKKTQESWENQLEGMAYYENEALLIGKSLWELTGLPGAVTVGQYEADRAVKEYWDCVKAGRKDCSKLETVFLANVATVGNIVSGLADIPVFIINTPLRWSVDKNEEIQKELEKRIEEYRPVTVARQASKELKKQAEEINAHLQALKMLDEKIIKLKENKGSAKEIQQRLDALRHNLDVFCSDAKEMSNQAPVFSNPETAASLIKGIADLKQYARQTCTEAEKIRRSIQGGPMDQAALELSKAGVKKDYLDKAEAQYAQVAKELRLLQERMKGSEDFSLGARKAQNDLKDYLYSLNQVSKNSDQLKEDYLKKLEQLDAAVKVFLNRRTTFFQSVRYFYNERTGEERRKILESARDIEALKLDVKKLPQTVEEQASRIKAFSLYAEDLKRLAQTKSEPCPELLTVIGLDPLLEALKEAEQRLAEGRHCYAELTGREPLSPKASIFISGPSKLKKGETGIFSGMISSTNVPENSLYFKWAVDGKETGQGKTISILGAAEGSYTLSAQLWVRDNPDQKLQETERLVVVEDQPQPRDLKKPAEANLDQQLDRLCKCIFQDIMDVEKYLSPEERKKYKKTVEFNIITPPYYDPRLKRCVGRVEYKTRLDNLSLGYGKTYPHVFDWDRTKIQNPPLDWLKKAPEDQCCTLWYSGECWRKKAQ